MNVSSSGDQMKCIAYVSRVSISDRSIRMPSGLSDIVKISRKNNPRSTITGIISYRDGQYLQVLEGPSLEVDQLMAKIATDPRHEDLWVFMDTDITERTFHNWGVSIFDFVDQGSFFDAFIEKNSDVFDRFNEYQKNRIQPFIDIKKPDTIPENFYENKDLRLMAWPDLNNESQPQMIMNLCIRLTKKPYPFNALVSSGEFGTHDEVTQTIKEFDRLGLLSVTVHEPLDEPTEAAPTETAPAETAPAADEKKPNRFYGAIKKFLGMG